jgi:Zn-dependent peptidase ImmA (M78 family)
VRVTEQHGVVVTLAPFAGSATPTVDAFSTSRLPRPVVVLTPDRAQDVNRHRFTAAHEWGHLIMHPDTAPGDPQIEKEADQFAAELLTPAESITHCCRID